ncbi:MAG: hypothetical protein ACYSSI_10835, partial [Planctomycetota bacterium]
MITKRITKGLKMGRFLHVVLLVFILGFLAGAPPWAQADIPRYINYQGKLVDAEDNPVTGELSVTVRIYNAQTGGTAFWTETQTATVTRGIFSILLGSTTALDDLDFNSEYWYSVEVASDGEMTPRQRLTTVAYAINADKLDGYDASQFLRADADTSLTGDLTVTGGVITGGANEDVEINPTGTGNILMTIDSTSGDFKVTDGTTNWLIVDNDTGNVTIANDLTVSGTIYGTISDSVGGNSFSSITVTGTSDLQGNISDSTGALTIADALTQTGASNQVTFAGNVDANNGLDVTGALTATGAATLSSSLDLNSNLDLDYSGTSAALDVNQASTGAAARFTGGKVIIGTDTTNTNAVSAGELYIQGDLEVDGTIYGSLNESDLTGAVLLSPSTAQTIQPTADVVPLTIKGQASGSANVLSIYDAGATPAEKIYVDSAGQMYVAEDTSSGAKNSAATLYFGRNATDDWESMGYDPTLGTKGKFTFSAPLQVEASSPTGITFVEKDEGGTITKSQGLTYDPDADEFSFTGGKLKQAFQNLIRNGSFESFRPGGWENHNTTWGTDMDMVENAAVAKFDSKYLRVLDNDNSQAKGMRYRVDMPTRLRGENLTMSVWARAASGTLNASIGYSYTSVATDASTAKNISLTTTWQNFIWTFPDAVTDSADVVVYVYLYGAGVNNPDSDGIGTITGTATNNVYVFFDGITLVQGKLALDYGPTPILDTGNQIIYGNLAIGANTDPVNTAAVPTLVFGEPSEAFYYSGYGGWSMESGQISYEQLG